MCTPAGEVRPHWQYLASALEGLNRGELDQRRAEAERLLRENGVTYNVYGDPAGSQRPWSLDLIPFLIPSEEWRQIEAGLAQRAEVLNLVLRDIYGPRDLLRLGLLPPELIYGHPGFLRPCHPLVSQKPHPLILYAADLARGADGRMSVISDRTQAPSGAGYALENRTVTSSIFPSVFRDSHVHRLAVFFQSLRGSLASYAPSGADEPRVVILTPGPLNETYFEHAYLANYLGYNLARGDDLVVREGRVWLRSVNRLEPVDVLWRRVDDNYCDPLELLPDSRLGIVGLVEAARQGRIAVVNPLGSSVLENPALHAFLPGIALHFLGRPLEFPSVPTWWCGQKRELRHVINNLDGMVIRLVHRRPNVRPVYGSLLSREQRRELIRHIRAEPHLYVGQEQIRLSCAPTLVDGKLTPRHAVLRAFLVARNDGYVVMPGGLTRVAPSSESLSVSNQAGGIAKDTWVIASEPEKQVSLLRNPAAIEPVSPLRPSLPPAAAENFFWFSRYAERADHGIRLMRTVLVYHSRTRFEEPYDQETLVALLQVLNRVTGTSFGLVGAQAATPPASLASDLTSSISNPCLRGGIAFNIKSLLQAANGVRDHLSTDTQRLLNEVQKSLLKLECLSGERFLEALEQIDELTTLLAGLSGLVVEGMLRGEAWTFWDIGRRIERSLLLATIVRGTLVQTRPVPVEADLLDAVLRTFDSLIVYRRVYNAPPAMIPTLALLLLDEKTPRALRFQLSCLEDHVAVLPREAGIRQLSEMARCVLEAVTAVRLVDFSQWAFADPSTGIRVAIDELLSRIEQLLRSTSDLLTRDYFVDSRGPRQLLRTEPPK